MMGSRGVYVRVGLLILGGIVILVALIWFLGGAGISRGLQAESYFSESVQGLEVGAPVKYRGVTLGRVTEIGLVNAEYGRDEPDDSKNKDYRLVFVRYVIDPTKVGRLPDAATAVQTGLRARVASQGITGLSYIELDFADPAKYPAQAVSWTPKAEYIPAMPSTLSQVQDAAQQALAKLNGIDIQGLASQLTGLLADLRAQFATGDVRQTLAGTAALMDTLKDAVRAADLPGLTADLRRTSGAVRDVVAGDDVHRLLANAALAADRLATVAAKLPALLAGLQATAQRAGNDTADVEQGLVPLLRDMRATAQNLRETTEALRRYPPQLLFGQPPPRTEPAR